MQPEAIIQIFGNNVAIDDGATQLGISHVLRPCNEPKLESVNDCQEIIPVIVNQNMTFVAYDTLADWETFKNNFSLHDGCFDAFGKLEQCPKFYSGICIVDCDIIKHESPIDAWYVLAAWESIQIAFGKVDTMQSVFFRSLDLGNPVKSLRNFGLDVFPENLLIILE